jgi:hypothetical protein
MAATASNTELPGTAGIIMTSLGPDWHMISSCRCCGVPDLLRVPSPSSCGWVLHRYRFSRHCFGYNVTVCAVLLLSWSWVRSLLIFQLERCGRWKNGTALFNEYSELLILHTHHITTLYSTSTKTQREITKVRGPKGVLKFAIKQVCITAQIGIFTRLLYSQQRYHKHAKVKSLTTHCQPACHTDHLPDNLEITGLRRFSRLLAVGVSLFVR